jgi:hypothetical protein
VLNNSVECWAPPFSGVVGSGRWCGVNVGSRVIRAGFTGTRGVLVSADASQRGLTIDRQVTQTRRAAGGDAILSQIALLRRRLDRSQLFDTL